MLADGDRQPTGKGGEADLTRAATPVVRPPPIFGRRLCRSTIPQRRCSMLEPYALKGACTVLRGGGEGNLTSLPDYFYSSSDLETSGASPSSQGCYSQKS